MQQTKYDVFISYSTIDANIAKAVCHKLEENGIRCWVAPRDIKPGADWALSITEAIKASKVFVLIFSENSNKSEQVPKELTLAVNYHLMVFPFKITETQPEGSFEYLLSDIHWLDAIDKPMDLSIEHMKNVIALYLNSDDTIDFVAKREEEERRLSSRIKRRKSFLIIRNIVLLLCVASMLLFFFFSFIKKTQNHQRKVDGYTATLYLMRYSDVDSVCHTNFFTDSLLKAFRYEKDYNDKGEYYIYPASDYVAYDDGQTVSVTHNIKSIEQLFPYHWPVIQLRLNSHAKKMITMSEAVLEISDFYRDDRPAFSFSINDKGLQIVNENFNTSESAQLLYSSLIPGESFIKYKKKEELFLDTPVQEVRLDNITDSILGQLVLPDFGTYGFVYGKRNTQIIPMCRADNDNIIVYNLSNAHNQEIHLKDFNRSLKENENDLGVYFRLSSKENAVFKMRIRIKVNGKKDFLYSNYVRVRIVGFSNDDSQGERR